MPRINNLKARQRQKQKQVKKTPEHTGDRPKGAARDAIAILQMKYVEMYEYIGNQARFKHLKFYSVETMDGMRYFCKDLNGHGGSQLKGFRRQGRKFIFEKSYTVSDDGDFQPMKDKHESQSCKTIDKKHLKIPKTRKVE